MIRPLALAAMLAAGGAAWAGDAPNFADYSGAAPFAGRNAAPVLTTPEAREFRTMIRDGARARPNFDGHYIVTSWGCGSDCETGAIVDAQTGRVVMLPVVAGTPADADAAVGHFAFRLDSRLLVATGMIGEEPPMASHYFLFDRATLTRLKTVPRPEAGGR